MNTINVNTRFNYDVVIGSGLIKSAGSIIHEKQKSGRGCENVKVLIVADEVVENYYKTVVSSLADIGYKTCLLSLSSGERCKSFEYVEKVLDYLNKNDFQREDIIVSVGGGSIGDLVGFVASIYKRGMRLVHIPTTLLAMIDSAVGGKTAINFSDSKNIIGSFYQPNLVIEDIDVLSTIDAKNLHSGVGELIKYGILNKAIFYKLFSEVSMKNIENLIVECIKLKVSYVVQDEYDLHERHFINLGHTVGHAIEVLSGFSTPHGIAVASGIMCIAKCCDKAYGTEVSAQIKRVLDIQNIYSDMPYTAESILTAIKKDKKWSYGKISVVLIDEIGKCRLADFSEDELSVFIRGGLNEV
ncbi:MAG: 3-dehydroquinate synthase [Clostridia bacterium]